MNKILDTNMNQTEIAERYNQLYASLNKPLPAFTAHDHVAIFEFVGALLETTKTPPPQQLAAIHAASALTIGQWVYIDYLIKDLIQSTNEPRTSDGGDSSPIGSDRGSGSGDIDGEGQSCKSGGGG